MADSLQALNQVVRANPALEEQLKAANNQQEYIQKAIQIGKTNGIDVSKADLEAELQKAQRPSGPGGELTEDQLESVAGGTFLELWYYNRFTSGSVKC
jgi:predicted ribosomally synthesized peptide with nif11-like leader